MSILSSSVDKNDTSACEICINPQKKVKKKIVILFMLYCSIHFARQEFLVLFRIILNYFVDILNTIVTITITYFCAPKVKDNHQMSRTIKIRKGADIRLVGAAENTLKESTAGSVYAIKPTDFHGLIPKLLLKEGAEVKKGTPLFHDKHNPAIVFTSPVSGEVAEIVRGAKRKI